MKGNDLVRFAAYAGIPFLTVLTSVQTLDWRAYSAALVAALTALKAWGSDPPGKVPTTGTPSGMDFLPPTPK